MKQLKWKTFKEEMPDFEEPIFVYQSIGGLYHFFNKKEKDNVIPCTYVRKSTSHNGSIHYLKGYEYGSTKEVGFIDNVFKKMKWIKVPNPIKK